PRSCAVCRLPRSRIRNWRRPTSRSRSAPRVGPGANEKWARVVKRLPGLTAQILIALVLGIASGYVWPSFGTATKPLADAFLRLIRMIIAPLVFSTLVVGIAGTGELKAMGRIGLKAVVYFEAATTIALLLGLALANAFQPGRGVALTLGGDTAAVTALAQNQQGLSDLFLHLFPTSVVD